MMTVDGTNEVEKVKVAGVMEKVETMVVIKIDGQNVNATTVERWGI